MNNLKIEDPDNFQFASTVIKDSKTGMSSNRRLLVIKGGHLYYYSNVPKSFTGDPKELQYFHQLPKSSIDILNIKKIRTSNETSPIFEIIFDERHMMERQDIRKTLTSENFVFTPKNNKEEVVWRFICDNQHIKQKWINIMLSLINHYQNQEDNIKKYFQNLNKGAAQENKQLFNRNLTVKNPWRDSAAEKKADYLNDRKSLAPEVLLKQDAFKKENNKHTPNSFSQQITIQEFQNSYPEKKHKIEDAFNYPTMKKQNQMANKITN